MRYAIYIDIHSYYGQLLCSFNLKRMTFTSVTEYFIGTTCLRYSSIQSILLCDDIVLSRTTKDVHPTFQCRTTICHSGTALKIHWADVPCFCLFIRYIRTKVLHDMPFECFSPIIFTNNIQLVTGTYVAG